MNRARAEIKQAIIESDAGLKSPLRVIREIKKVIDDESYWTEKTKEGQDEQEQSQGVPAHQVSEESAPHRSIFDDLIDLLPDAE